MDGIKVLLAAVGAGLLLVFAKCWQYASANGLDVQVLFSTVITLFVLTGIAVWFGIAVHAKLAVCGWAFMSWIAICPLLKNIAAAGVSQVFRPYDYSEPLYGRLWFQIVVGIAIVAVSAYLISRDQYRNRW